MRSLRIIHEGLRALSAHKLRAFFMMTGAVVGVAALIVITATTKGAAEKIRKRVSKWPLDVIKVNAGGGKGYTLPQEGTTTLKPDDADAIREQIPGLVTVTSVAERRGLWIERNGRQTGTNIFAIEPNWHEVMNWRVKEGEPVSPEDIATLARVCILGETIREELFGDQNPIGEVVQVGKVRFRVKGILTARGSGPSGRKSDDRILIPLTTGLRRVFNQDYLSYVRMEVEDPGELEATADKVRELLHERHHITPPQEDDFSIVHAALVLAASQPISKTLSFLLVFFAGLSLIVGGIVLMNIMLISITERTREIGLRRALGATRRDIFIQFLGEALLVTLLGIVFGGSLGWGVSAVLALRRVPVMISWVSFALATAFALLVGVLAGVQPARRAARLRPVEALK